MFLTFFIDAGWSQHTIHSGRNVPINIVWIRIAKLWRLLMLFPWQVNVLLYCSVCYPYHGLYFIYFVTFISYDYPLHPSPPLLFSSFLSLSLSFESMLPVQGHHILSHIWYQHLSHSLSLTHMNTVPPSLSLSCMCMCVCVCCNLFIGLLLLYLYFNSCRSHSEHWKRAVSLLAWRDWSWLEWHGRYHGLSSWACVVIVLFIYLD